MKQLVKGSGDDSAGKASRMGIGVQGRGVGSNAGSDASLNSEMGDKEKSGSLKDKMKGIFKRSSRSPSVERKVAPPNTIPSSLQFQPKTSKEPTPSRDTREGTPGSVSTQRPLMPSSVRPLMPSQTQFRR